MVADVLPMAVSRDRVFHEAVNSGEEFHLLVEWKRVVCELSDLIVDEW